MTINTNKHTSRNPQSCPHPPIPAARLLFVFLRRSVFFLSTWGKAEVGGGDNLLGFLGDEV